MDFVSSGEDGSVVVWQGTEMLQSIPHPKTVWVVLGYKTSSPSTNRGIFMTGGQDGLLRIFSKESQFKDNTAIQQLNNEFIEEVAAAKQAKNNGPTAEDLAKATKWENRGNVAGKSEHQIMVFNRDNRLIAAEWANGSWVFVGDVTGKGGDDGGITASDAGELNGVHYDHILPVEIETSTGLKTLQLGYNSLENPFVAAQRFIDANGIGQYYLQQVADWILQRSGGGGGSGSQQPHPRTASMGSQSSSPKNPNDSLMIVESVPKHLFSFIIDGFAVFNDIPNISKLVTKLKELNSQVSSEYQIPSSEMTLMEKLLSTLEQTSYYHSSKISVEEINAIASIVSRWTNVPDLTVNNNLFIIFDILRMLLVHPQAVELFQSLKCRSAVLKILQSTKEVFSLVSSSLSYQVFLTALRFFCNFLKNEQILLQFMTASSSSTDCKVLLEEIFQLLNNSSLFNHSNKLVRLSIVTAFNNLFYLIYIRKHPSLVEWLLSQRKETDGSTNGYFDLLLKNCYHVIINESETMLVVFRSFQIMNTILQYSDWKSSSSSFAPFPDVDPFINSVIKHGESHSRLTNAMNFWKDKENSKEVVTCFTEFLAL
jgi:phospholipase A-2-activating protein